MFKLSKKPKIKIQSSSDITIVYSCYEENVAFDICDHEGNLIKTGKLNPTKTNITLEEKKNGDYYLFILDGPHIFSKKFSLAS